MRSAFGRHPHGFCFAAECRNFRALFCDKIQENLRKPQIPGHEKAYRRLFRARVYLKSLI
jgi:hypothetical protein